MSQLFSNQINRARFAFYAGDRVITRQGESGILILETFRGPWPGYQMGWWVYFDRDYAKRMLAVQLASIVEPLQDVLFAPPTADARPESWPPGQSTTLPAFTGIQPKRRKK